MYKGSMSHLGMRGGFTSVAFYCLTSRCQPWNRCSAALAVKEERGSSREESSSPWQDGFLGIRCNHLAWSYHLHLKLLEEVLFISIIIFDTYILAADTYYCLSHQVAPSLMVQSGYLPAPAAKPGLGSIAGLELQGAQTRQPAAKPHPYRLLQHYNWCYSEEQSNSSGDIPCVFKKKKKYTCFGIQWSDLFTKDWRH